MSNQTEITPMLLFVCTGVQVTLQHNVEGILPCDDVLSFVIGDFQVGTKVDDVMLSPEQIWTFLRKGL